MCSIILKKISNDPTFLSKVIWTDECYLKLNGTSNSHNIRWWTRENPHIYLEKSLNAEGVMVFMGLSVYGPIGPFFWRIKGKCRQQRTKEAKQKLCKWPQFQGNADWKNHSRDQVNFPPWYLQWVRFSAGWSTWTYSGRSSELPEWKLSK